MKTYPAVRVITVAVLVALVLRIYFLSQTGFIIDSDEAIVGLMAQHFLALKEWSVFYYGQPYMGSLEPTLTAAVFWLVGISSASLKVVPLIFSSLLIVAVYELGRRATKLCDVPGDKGALGGLIAAVFTAVGPYTLVVWSTKARGGFIELVFLGTVSLVIASDLFRSRSYLEARKRVCSLGLVLGLAWWTNNQAIFYIGTISLVALSVLPRTFGYFNCFKLTAIGGFSFIIGGAPFWYYNLVESPKLQTFKFLSHGTTLSEALSHFGGFLTTALPIITGARRAWQESTDLFFGSSVVVLVLWLVVLCLVARYLFRSTESPKLNRSVGVDSNRPTLSLLILFPIVTGVVFSASSFGWLAQEPRYLLPLYSVMGPLVGVAVVLLSRFSKALGGVLAISALTFSLASSILGMQSLPGQPFVYRGERVVQDQTSLYRWLLAQGYTQIRTNYWIGYRAAFETGEQIKFSQFRGDRVVRIREYEEGPDAKVEDGVYVLTPIQANDVGAEFERLGYRYRRTSVGGYVVLDQFSTVSERGWEIKLTPEAITTSSRLDWRGWMIDDELSTRWGSGETQKPGMFVEVTLPQPQVVTGLDLEVGLFQPDYPRALKITGIDTTGKQSVLFDGPIGELPSGKFQLYVAPQALMRIRIEQTGAVEVFDWSVAELRVYGELKTKQL